MIKMFWRLCCVIAGKHNMGEWHFLASDSCVQQRECVRCGDSTEQRITHESGTWQASGLSPCSEEKLCGRDGTRLALREQHLWGDWQEIEGAICTERRTCQRCQRGETRTHDLDSCCCCKKCGESFHEYETTIVQEEIMYGGDGSCYAGYFGPTGMYEDREVTRCRWCGN